MRYLLLALLLSGCTLRVETRSDEQIVKDEHTKSNEELLKYCEAKCLPHLVVAFIPVDYRCICDATIK